MNDEDIDLELRRAIKAEAYRPPMILRPISLQARLAADTAGRRRRAWRTAWAAALIAGIAVVAIILSRAPWSTGVGQVMPTETCEVSTVIGHGTWWKEIGGPNAFFNVDPDDFYAEPNNWLIIIRFDPDASHGQLVQMWADRLGPGDHVPGSYNSPMDPTNIFHGPDPAPQLPGGWYLFEQRLPVPGCWRLSAAIDGRPVGAATLRVRAATSLSLPVGTYMTDRAIPGELCFAFESSSARYEEVTAVRAWWWAQGQSGECRTRTSDVVSSTANIVPREGPGYDLVIRIPLTNGETREIRVALQMSGGSLAGVVLSADNASVFFRSVLAVDPSFAPGN